MSWYIVGTIAVSAYSTYSANKAIKKAQATTAEQMEMDREERRIAREEFNKRIEKYEKTDYVPLDVDALKTEDVYEDVDLSEDVLPAADYAKEQFQQQQANIMQGLRGVAGSSGVAGLAQSLSMQAKDQSREQSVSMGRALAQGRQMALASKAQMQQQERGVMIENMRGKNAFELDKMATLMGVSGQKAYAATQSLQQGQQNMMQLQSANQQMWANTANSAAQIYTAYKGQ